MKKCFALALALVLALCLAAPALNEEAAPTVYVTIANGELMLVQAAVELTDTDADGLLTVNDALYLAHEAYYEGGAEAGYASAQSEWGLSLVKLWGVENGGSYGYYVNNAAAYSLTDVLSDGDSLVAFVYTDLVAWSDFFCYFDTNTLEATAGDEVTLTLLGAGYDENWMPVTLPVAGANIVIDGAATEYKTAEDGTVTIVLPEGARVISAVSESATLVPPACVIAQSEAAEAAA